MWAEGPTPGGGGIKAMLHKYNTPPRAGEKRCKNVTVA